MDRVLAEFEEVREVATATPGAAAWTARDPGTGRPVLIKRLREDSLVRTRATQSLALEHPNIVRTRRWMRDERALYVIRDFVPGRNLRSILADLSQRAFDRLQTLLGPVIDALDHAHRFGLPHGGVTPENVLVEEDGTVTLSDFASIDNTDGAHRGYVPRSLLNPQGQPMARTDYYSLCEIYKEFLPLRSADDEAGAAARTRLLRNISETQQSAGSIDELRYKLDAIAKMADLLGFSSRDQDSGEDGTLRRGARLICAVSPPAAALTAGGGTMLTLSVGNEGDTPLHVEAVGADVVWLNLPSRFQPFSVGPDGRRDLLWTVSGARLRPGAYNANLIVRSNSGMVTERPVEGTPWNEQTIAVPVLVSGTPGTNAFSLPPGPVPLAERLPAIDSAVIAPAPSLPPERSALADARVSEIAPEPEAPAEGQAPDESTQDAAAPAPVAVHIDHPGIAVTQDPDPALARAGQNGVVHLGVRNIGESRIRIDKVSTWPSWLVYPGSFQAVWIEPDATQYLGFSVVTSNLPGGDYRAHVTFAMSVMEETLLGARPIRREMRCEVRVRVVRDGAGAPGDLNAIGPGCGAVLVALLSSAGLIGLWTLFVR